MWLRILLLIDRITILCLLVFVISSKLELYSNRHFCVEHITMKATDDVYIKDHIGSVLSMYAAVSH
jgi:hypothetical protein